VKVVDQSLDAAEFEVINNLIGSSKPSDCNNVKLLYIYIYMIFL